jgi:hypothetical protein
MSGNQDELDELIGELTDLERTFEAAAREDSRRRQEADEFDGGAEGGGGGGGGGGQGGGGGSSGADEREYEATTHLVVPHEAMAGSAQRPLDRRPNGPPPLRSVALTHSAPTRSYSGFSQGSRYDYSIPVVTAGDSYTVDCRVHNLGGLAANATTVELFVTHLDPDATLDRNPSTNEVELHPGQVPPTAGGVTTLPPESTVTMVAFMDEGSGLQVDNQLLVGLDRRVESDRSFADSTFGGRPGTFVGTSRSVPQRDEFTVRVYDTTDTTYGRQPQRSNLNDIVVNSIDGSAPLLTEAPGRYTTSVGTRPVEMTLEGTVQGAASVTGRTLPIPQAGQATASFQYDHTPPGTDAAGTTVLHARAYSMAPEDAPGDWGRLDHTTMRHVGRTELYWASEVP